MSTKIQAFKEARAFLKSFEAIVDLEDELRQAGSLERIIDDLKQKTAAAKAEHDQIASRVAATQQQCGFRRRRTVIPIDCGHDSDRSRTAFR